MDRPGRPRNPLDEAVSFQREHHLVHRGRCHAEIPLHVGFSWSHSVNLGVIENERQPIVPERCTLNGV